jgi:4-amino-4-deoxy-L-arabinose transferase-like glycosyltransferase
MNEENQLEDWAPRLVLVVTLVGGVLRVMLLGTKGMWLDETFSVWLANQSTADMLQWIVRIDQHPPLYYLLLHSWIALLGDTPYYVRLLSALFGTATIPIIYLIGKRLSGAGVGLAAAVFLALSPFNIYFAQETRMYTLLTFNAAVAIYALVRLLTDSRSVLPIGSQLRAYVHAWRTPRPLAPAPPGEFSYADETRKRTGWRAWIDRQRWPPIRTMATDLAWLAFIVFSAATMLSHNTAVFFPMATNIFVLGLVLVQRIRKTGPPPALRAPSVGNWVKAQIGIFLLWSPWAFVFVRQASKVDQQFWIPKPTWDIIAQTLRSLMNASAPGQASQVIVLGLLCVVLGLGLVYYRKRLSIFLLLVTLFAVPFLGELLVSVRRPIFYDRTLIWITIPLLLLLAAGIVQLRFRLLVIVVLGILATNYLFSAGDYYRFYRKEDWSTAAGYVANFAEKGDLVLFNSNFVAIPFDYYFEPYEKQYALQVVKQGVPLDLFDDGVLEPTMTDGDVPRLVSLVSGHDRVWLVYSHDSYTDPMGLIPEALAAQKKLIQAREFHGGQVQLYETP